MMRRYRDWLTLGYCLLVAGICLAICSKSSPLYPINDWTDANAYFSCGKGMLAGRVMYRDLYEHKGPLLYALHALCALVDARGFLGVWMMETLAVALFLMAAYKLLVLYGAGGAARFALPLIALAVLASFSFQQGDSAEELCLPMLGWSLYGLLTWLRQGAPARMAAQTLLLHGVLGGCVLWMKFTLLGFYAPWLLGILLTHLIRREWKNALTAVAWFAAGALLATLPWLVYFGVNGAILPWLKTYVYDNLFLYRDGEALSLTGRLRAIARAGWDWLAANPGYTVPVALGLVWFAWPTKPGRDQTGGNRLEQTKKRETDPISAVEKRFLCALFAFAALGVFYGGKSYVYYGLILAVFTPVFFIPLCRWAARWPRLKPGATAALLCLAALGAGGLCALASPNRGDLLKPRADTMQYRFAALVAQTPAATLLNYGFMDAGFYTACNIAPSVKYFHQTNVHLEEMYAEQARYVAEGLTDYVVTRGRQPDTILQYYDLVAVADAPADFWYRQVFLYRRKGL